MAAISISGLQVVVLTVADLERSRRFYTDLLGLSLVNELPTRFLEYVVGGIPFMLHLDIAGVNLGRETPAPGLDLYLGVDDVDAAVEHLRTSGVVILEEPTTQVWGKRDACVADPDGYRIHVSSAAIGSQTGRRGE